MALHFKHYAFLRGGIRKMYHLVVTEITEGGLAALHDIRIGDVIYRVNGNAVRNNVEFSRELSKAVVVKVISVNRSGQDIEITLPEGKLGIVVEEAVVNLDDQRQRHKRESLEKKISVATMDGIDGQRIASVVGVVSSEYAVGLNLIKDVLVSGRDIFGGRSKVVQDALREARKICLDELRNEAEQVGGNGILGVRFQHSQISSTGTTMLLVVCTGTAVVLQPT